MEDTIIKALIIAAFIGGLWSFCSVLWRSGQGWHLAGKHLNEWATRRAEKKTTEALVNDLLSRPGMARVRVWFHDKQKQENAR